MLENNKWAKKYDKCIVCGTIERRHHGSGMCINCFQHKYKKLYPERRRKSRRKYDKGHPEKIKLQNARYYKKHRKVFLEKCKIYQTNHRKEKSEYDKEYRKLNIKRIKIINKKYRQNNSDKLKVKRLLYRKNNVEKIKEYNRNHQRIRKQTDIRYKIKCRISTAINGKLKCRIKNKGGKRTWNFLPYTVEDLIIHLERQFEPWMNWKNYGNTNGCWNIDHIKPDCSFNYKSVEDKEFQECWALSNLRPLDAIENSRKGGKVIY